MRTNCELSSEASYFMIDSLFRWGHTPIQEAERENHMAVVEFLKAVSSSEQT